LKNEDGYSIEGLGGSSRSNKGTKPACAGSFLKNESPQGDFVLL
jgi:hypothetical protein